MCRGVWAKLPLPSALHTALEDYLKQQEEILRSQLSPELDVDLNYDFKTFVENLTIHLVNSFADMLAPIITPEDANYPPGDIVIATVFLRKCKATQLCKSDTIMCPKT